MCCSSRNAYVSHKTTALLGWLTIRVLRVDCPTLHVHGTERTTRMTEYRKYDW